MARRFYSNTALQAILTAGINNVVTTVPVSTIAGLPATPFSYVLDRNVPASLEVVEVTAVAGLNLTVTRGVDGTTAVAHSINALAEHTSVARDFDEANAHVNTAHVTSVATRTGPVTLTAADIGTGTFPGSLTMPVNTSIFFNITGSATAAEIRAAGVDFDIKVGSANGMRFVNNAYTLAIATLSNAGAFTITDRFTVANAGTQGLISVAYNGAGADNDSYGIVGITAPASVNRAYYSMTAAGNSVYGLGIGADNVMRIGAVTTSKAMGASVVKIDASANITTPGTITSPGFTTSGAGAAINITSRDTTGDWVEYANASALRWYQGADRMTLSNTGLLTVASVLDQAAGVTMSDDQALYWMSVI